MIRIACVQCSVVFGDPAANANWAVDVVRDLASDGISIAVFPEAFLTGYCFGSAADARKNAIRKDSDSLKLLGEAAMRNGLTLVVGFAEQSYGSLFNSAAILFRDGRQSVYRKTHLPDLGLDRFVEQGQELAVWADGGVKFGTLICFDVKHPEPSRILALKGADLIALPTNWPVGAERTPEVFPRARAIENKVYFAACNRVGIENGFEFIGQSQIIAPDGEILAKADGEEAIIVADANVQIARKKRNVMIAGVYETETLASRRPELYAQLVDNELRGD